MSEPIVEEAKLIEANPCYVHIYLQNSKETVVLLRDLAPAGFCKTTLLKYKTLTYPLKILRH